MKRGEIYFIHSQPTCGSEITKGRPAIVVSCDSLNRTSDMVTVVYLTSRPKRDMGVHVAVNATGKPSTALCEQISAVSVMRVGDYCGTCTEDEMRAIDKALLSALGLEDPKLIAATRVDYQLIEELQRVTAERDRYARMVDHLLEPDND